MMPPASRPRFRGAEPQPAPAPRHGRRNRRPTLERLEGRTLFASYAAATVAELVAAINTANATGKSDTITLPAGATFLLSAVNNATNGATGLPTITRKG